MAVSLLDSLITNVQQDTPVSGQCTITVSSTLTADEFNGLELRVARPEESSGRLLYAEVLDCLYRKCHQA